MDRKSLLLVKDLHISFERDKVFHEVVKGIDFEVFAGRTLGVVGESGSGKSVSNLAIMRLLDERKTCVKADSLSFLGQELLRLTEREMEDVRGCKIAMIFQEPMTSLNPIFRCGDQITEAILAHRKMSRAEARERVITLFRKVLLPRPEEIFDSYPHQLSGGQKQRVMIAMALSCEPQLLIADEPTTALDVTVQKEILALLRSLQAENGMGMIFITHDLAVVSEIADDVVVMHHGTIVERGTVEEVLHNPRDPYTRGLLACRPHHKQRLWRLPVVQEFLDGQWKSQEDIEARLAVSGAERAEHLKSLYSTEPVLRVEGLSTVFGNVKAVDNVSFDVFRGETVGLVGESGCGKTTLGRSILRLTEPTGGKVFFEGEDVVTLRGASLRRFRQRVQIVFQDPYSSLNPRIPIGSAIAEPMGIHHLITDRHQQLLRVGELLEQVGLSPDVASRYPHEFSGGQRQRICIARALAVNPQLIICDESVSALDVSVQAQVLNLLNNLKETNNLTYIFISHDLGVVRFMSDRILVMYKGQRVELNDADEVFFNPSNEYTQRLIKAIPGNNL